ncbi:MAG TPA: NDP-sugar synthase [Armatimonadota bacterium]|jgi:mannose-1-phosphate guanylyltransferase
MDAILLVGGFGTRLLPLTKILPKPLIPLANVPFVERTVGWLRDAGVDHVILSLHYNADQFRDYFTERLLGVDLSFAIEEEPLGTGGAIKNCEPYLRSSRCYIFNGDIFTSLDLRGMLDAHLLANASVSIAMKEVDDPSRYGVIVTDAVGRIRTFTEKPPRELAPSRDINAGVYLFEREVFSWFPAGRSSVERDIFPLFLQRGIHLQGYREPMYWTDLGTPQDYLQAHRDILAGHVLVPLAYAELSPGIWCGDDVSIGPAAHLQAPAILGHSVRIHTGALVGPRVVLGDGVRIEEAAVVEDSILWEGVTVRPHSTVSGCIIGRFAHVAGEQNDTLCEDYGNLPAEQFKAAA